MTKSLPTLVKWDILEITKAEEMTREKYKDIIEEIGDVIKNYFNLDIQYVDNIWSFEERYMKD